VNPQCPYCHDEVEINHDDGYGYEEDNIFNQYCGNCGKTFIYTTSIHFYYDLERADCLNGSPHNWKKIVGYPEVYFKNKRRCCVCSKEMELDQLTQPPTELRKEGDK